MSQWAVRCKPKVQRTKNQIITSDQKKKSKPGKQNKKKENKNRTRQNLVYKYLPSVENKYKIIVMFTHRAHKDYIFKHTFNVPPLVPLVQYNFKQTIEEKKDIVFFVLLQIRGSNDTTCMCVFHLYSCVSIISQYCYILQEPALSLIFILISCISVRVLHFVYLVSIVILCYYMFTVLQVTRLFF